MYEGALNSREKTLGPDRTSTLRTVRRLGSLYKDQGKLKEAEEMNQRLEKVSILSLNSHDSLTFT